MKFLDKTITSYHQHFEGSVQIDDYLFLVDTLRSAFEESQPFEYLRDKKISFLYRTTLIVKNVSKGYQSI